VTAEGELPDALRRCLESDYEQMIRSNGGFVTRFYERLFALRPALASMFGRSAADQSVHLALAMRDLVDFHRRERLSRFRDHVQAHVRMGITEEDADAFRRAFVAEVVATREPSEPNMTPQMHGDAWNAVLKLGIDELLDRSDPNPRVAAQ
jgi:hemoglobin-like flavoprotein